MTLVRELLWPLTTAVVAVLIYKCFTFYQQLSYSPPGPFPLPLLGSLLEFRKKQHLFQTLTDVSKRFGPIFRMFHGSQIVIVITDPVLAVETMKKHTIAGRPKLLVTDILFRKGSIDIVFGDFNREWEALRKIGHSAARKYAISPMLIEIVSDVVDLMINKVSSQPFSATEHIPFMMTMILSRAAFGKKYQHNDPEFLRWQEASHYLNDNVMFVQIISVFTPLKLLFWNIWNRVIRECDFMNQFIEEKYRESLAMHQEGVIRTFCDAIISAHREAEVESKWMLPHLKLQNLFNIVHNLFQAGSDTTQTTLRWVFLFIAKYPDMQSSMRQEVDAVIGDSIPSIDHPRQCHYVNAFIAEVMRFRNIVTLGVPHKTTVDTEIAGYIVKKDTPVTLPLYHCMHHTETWGDPEIFRPERFLNQDETFVPKPNPMFVPFGYGRRSCPGNKLAINNLFLVVAKFLQKTSCISVLNVDEVSIDGNLDNTNLWTPHDYQIQLTLRTSEETGPS
jgi:cytochrome P450